MFASRTTIRSIPATFTKSVHSRRWSLTTPKAKISSEIRDVDPASLENLPVGLDGSAYQWVDLDGEGLTGILAEQDGAWYYKRNLSALPQPTATGSLETRACFAPVECVARLPASAAGGRHQFLDLAGDGSIDVVDFSGPTPGFYERTDEGGWTPFTPFRSLPECGLGRSEPAFHRSHG